MHKNYTMKNKSEYPYMACHTKHNVTYYIVKRSDYIERILLETH